MNAIRRNRISAVIQKLGECKEEIEAIKDEEQEAFDNMPEGLQQSERGEASETAISYLESAVDNADGVITQLEEIE